MSENSVEKDALARLESLGFTPTEARVYINLIGSGHQTGYQAARELNLSRSSVYAALDSLCRKGAVYPIPGESDTKQYQPEDPEALLDRILRDTREATKDLSRQLKSLQGFEQASSYVNIEGKTNIMEKCRDLLRQARREVFLNTDFSLAPLFPELEDLSRRGVRVLIFSFQPLDTGNLPLEFFHSPPEQDCGPGETRLMVAADNQTALIAGVENGAVLRGTFSSSPLLVSIVSEHIHHDIYLLRLRQKFGHDPSEEGIRLNTAHEETSGLPRLRPLSKNKENK